MLKNSIAASFVGTITLAVPVYADVQLSFIWGRQSVGVQPGNTVSIPLFLRETLTGSSSSLVVGGGGLGSVGVGVTGQTNPPGLASRATVTAFTGNSTDFFDTSDPVFGPEVSFSGGGLFGRFLVFGRRAGLTGTVISPGVRQVLIGSVSFTGGTQTGLLTTFTAGDYGAGSSDTITWQSLQTLDSLIQTARIRVVTVASLEPCLADVNLDFIVDGSDFVEFVNSFADGVTTSNSAADVNLDGTIDGNDFVEFVNAFTAGC